MFHILFEMVVTQVTYLEMGAFVNKIEKKCIDNKCLFQQHIGWNWNDTEKQNVVLCKICKADIFWMRSSNVCGQEQRHWNLMDQSMDYDIY